MTARAVTIGEVPDVAVVASCMPETLPPGKFGRVTMRRVLANGWSVGCRVTLDGEDVTSGCVECDDVEGYVVHYQRYASGGELALVRNEDGELDRVLRRGVVTFSPGNYEAAVRSQS